MTSDDIMDDYIRIKNEENDRLYNENKFLRTKLSMYEEEEHIFLGKLIYERNDKSRMYVTNSRNFIPNTKAWQYNRKLDEAHVKELKKIILEHGYLEGNIDAIECEDEYCIVNGQHRVMAMKEIMENDEKFNMEIIVNIHPVDSFESEKANDIFKATNNSKNVESEELPQIKLQKITERLRDRFPKEITNNPSGRANMHRIDQKTIYNMLQYNDTFNDSEKDVEYFVNKIIAINTKLSLRSYEGLFGNKRRNDKKDKVYKGALDSGFYLGVLHENQLAILFQKEL